MKATVMEITGKHAVLLTKDGTFIKMKCRNLKIGDVVSVKETKKFKTGKLGGQHHLLCLWVGESIPMQHLHIL